jgi:hypothetical protein
MDTKEAAEPQNSKVNPKNALCYNFLPNTQSSQIVEPWKDETQAQLDEIRCLHAFAEENSTSISSFADLAMSRARFTVQTVSIILSVISLS